VSHSKKYVISDLHFGHKNILTYSEGLRGGTTMEEHDQWLIDQINSKVTKHDLLYILGDICIDNKAIHLMKKVRGNKMLVRGNHDICATKQYLEYFQEVHGLLSYRGTFWMTHAPMHPESLRGRFNLHGHVHQNSLKDERYINCCVEMTYGVPQSLDDLFEQYKDKVVKKKKENGSEHE
jgi:calcineurin-like phosphoesterase family protein